MPPYMVQQKSNKMFYVVLFLILALAGQTYYNFIQQKDKNQKSIEKIKEKIIREKKLKKQRQEEKEKLKKIKMA